MPAIHDGHQVKVFAGFTVVFKKTNEGINSTLLMNRLSSKDKFGTQYIAPQRVSSGRMWVIMHGGSVGSVWGEITVDVDSEGTPSNPRVSRVDRGPKYKIDHFAKKMNDHCFISGFADGIAVEMPYSEVFHN